MADNFLSKFRRKNSSPEVNPEQGINTVTSAPDNWHKKTQGPNRHDFRGFVASDTKQRFHQKDDYPEDDNNEEKFGGFVFNNNTKKNNEQKRNIYSNNNNNNNNNNNTYSNYPNNQKSNPLKKKSNPKYNQNTFNKKKQNKVQNHPQQQYQKDYHPSEEQLTELEQLQQHLLTCGISIGPNDNDINQPSNLQQNSDNEFAELLNKIHDDDSEPNDKLNYEQQFQQQIYIEAEKKKNDKKKPKKKKQKNKIPQYQQQMHIINNPPEFSTPHSFDPLHFGYKQFPSKSNNHNNPNPQNFPPGIMPPPQQFQQPFGPQIFPEPMMSMPMQDFPLGPNIQLPPPGMIMPMMGQNPSLGMPMQMGAPPGFLNNQMMPPPSFGFNTQFNMPPPIFYSDQMFNPMGMNDNRNHKDRNHKKQYQMGNPNFPNLSQTQHPTSLQWDVDDHNEFAISQQQHEQMENLMKVLEQNQFHSPEDEEHEEHEEIPIPPPKPKKKLNLNSIPFDPNNKKN